MQNPAEQPTHTRNNIKTSANKPTQKLQTDAVLHFISEYQQVAESLSRTCRTSQSPSMPTEKENPSRRIDEKSDPIPNLSRRNETEANTLSVVSSADSAWNEILTAIDPRTRFFCDTWIPLLEKSYGFKPYAIVSKNRNTINGVLPFLEVNSAFTGKRGISLPFIDFCHSFHSTKEVYLGMYDELKRFGHSQNWDYFELRGDFHHLENVEPSLSFYNHVIDLSKGTKATFANLNSAAQRAVRKARKEGVQVEESRDISAIDTFYKLQYITRRRHGLPPQPHAFFRNLHKQIIEQGNGSIFTARVNGKPVSSSIFIQQADIVHYKYGASDYRYQNTRCNNLVMWTAIEAHANQGFNEMHLGRNSLGNQGLRKYKLSWGSKEGRTQYHRYNLKKNQISTMSDDVYGWYNQIFKCLPKPLVILIGTILYKHIA